VPPQDPHLSFPFGGTADFRGRDGQHYCFLSAPRLAINIKTEDATFRLHNLYDEGGTLVVDGSFITEVHFVARVGGRKNKLCLASFWASEFKCDARGKDPGARCLPIPVPGLSVASTTRAST